MMAWTAATIIGIASVAIAAGTLTHSIVNAPGTPEVPKPPAPPPPPPGVQPPPKPAPTTAEADAGVTRARRERQRSFGLDQTILNTPTLGSGSGDSARRRTGGNQGLGAGSIF